MLIFYIRTRGDLNALQWFVYGTLFWFGTNLAKENEPEENPQDLVHTK